MRSHLPLNLWREKLDAHPEVKVIQTMRDPGDTLVSYFHHFRSDAMIGAFNGTWDDFFTWFQDGRLPYGDPFIHATEWYKYNVRRPNSLIVKYEDVLSDPRREIRRIAKFLDYDLRPSEIDLIAKKTTFDAMKPKWDAFMAHNPMWHCDKSTFMRRGGVGDARNYLTEAQATFLREQKRRFFAPLNVVFSRK